MYTSHGHHIDGTVLEDIGNRVVARCGGPGLCGDCSKEAASVVKDVAEYHDEQTMTKVRNALSNAGLGEIGVHNAITEMQNAGILFRERR